MNKAASLANICPQCIERLLSLDDAKRKALEIVKLQGLKKCPSTLEGALDEMYLLIDKDSDSLSFSNAKKNIIEEYYRCIRRCKEYCQDAHIDDSKALILSEFIELLLKNYTNDQLSSKLSSPLKSGLADIKEETYE